MAIDRIGRTDDFDRLRGVADSKNPETRGPVRGPADSDSVDLSVQKSQVDALVDEARKLPEIRQSLVDAIRGSLADGSHEVDPRRLARAILEFEDGFTL